MATQKPGAIPNLGDIPFIDFGEVKNVRSYRRALEQLASRRRRGTTALALYDDQGNVHLQVFKPKTVGVPDIAFNGPIGRVSLPRRDDGTPITPGTAPFGNAIEKRVLDLLAMVTGQRFRAKRANASGPDIVHRELATIHELLENETMRPVVDKIVRAGQKALRDYLATKDPPKHRTARLVKEFAELGARALRLIRGLSRYEIDILSGVLYGLEVVTGQTPESVRQFRGAAAAKLGMLTS